MATTHKTGLRTAPIIRCIYTNHGQISLSAVVWDLRLTAEEYNKISSSFPRGDVQNDDVRNNVHDDFEIVCDRGYHHGGTTTANKAVPWGIVKANALRGGG